MPDANAASMAHRQQGPPRQRARTGRSDSTSGSEAGGGSTPVVDALAGAGFTDQLAAFAAQQGMRVQRTRGGAVSFVPAVDETPAAANKRAINQVKLDVMKDLSLWMREERYGILGPKNERERLDPDRTAYQLATQHSLTPEPVSAGMRDSASLRPQALTVYEVAEELMASQAEQGRKDAWASMTTAQREDLIRTMLRSNEPEYGVTRFIKNPDVIELGDGLYHAKLDLFVPFGETHTGDRDRLLSFGQEARCQTHTTQLVPCVRHANTMYLLHGPDPMPNLKLVREIASHQRWSDATLFMFLACVGHTVWNKSKYEGAQQILLYMLGASQTGKSTLQECLKGMFAPEDVASLSISRGTGANTDSRFFWSTALGKRAVVVTEASHETNLQKSTLLSITSRESFQQEEKGRAPVESVLPIMWFGGNTMVRSDDSPEMLVRAFVWPFFYPFRGDEKKQDVLPQATMSGELGWLMVAGCRAARLLTEATENGAWEGMLSKQMNLARQHALNVLGSAKGTFVQFCQSEIEQSYKASGMVRALQEFTGKSVRGGRATLEGLAMDTLRFAYQQLSVEYEPVGRGGDNLFLKAVSSVIRLMRRYAGQPSDSAVISATGERELFGVHLADEPLAGEDAARVDYRAYLHDCGLTPAERMTPLVVAAFWDPRQLTRDACALNQSVDYAVRFALSRRLVEAFQGFVGDPTVLGSRSVQAQLRALWTHGDCTRVRTSLLFQSLRREPVGPNGALRFVAAGSALVTLGEIERRYVLWCQGNSVPESVRERTARAWRALLEEQDHELAVATLGYNTVLYSGVWKYPRWAQHEAPAAYTQRLAIGTMLRVSSRSVREEQAELVDERVQALLAGQDDGRPLGIATERGTATPAPGPDTWDDDDDDDPALAVDPPASPLQPHDCPVVAPGTARPQPLRPVPAAPSTSLVNAGGGPDGDPDEPWALGDLVDPDGLPI